MSKKVISYDLGTGGVKASIYDTIGRELSNIFIAYETSYPKHGWHEQKPEDWWNAVVSSTKKLIKNSNVNLEDIVSLAISGHSLGVVPIGKDGSLLRDSTPIWSDTRAVAEADEFFSRVDYKKWYYTTGAGFPANLYSIFKIKWYKNNEPEMYSEVDKFIGTKDYINYRLTGILCTDHSYASGSGVYNLLSSEYCDFYIEQSGIDKKVLPTIFPSTHIIGTLTKEAAELLGLPENVQVAAGGVDNACMALGAKGIKNGRVYTSLGSSAWIAVTADKPIVDYKIKSYVFAHIIPGMYASATAIFSAGTSHKWVMNQMCTKDATESAYEDFEKLAEESPVGSNKIIFNPSLAGGSGLDDSPSIRGSFLGIDLKHTKSDLARATLEGISLNLRVALDALNSVSPVRGDMLIVGGGTKSPLWMQIFSDTYKMKIIETNVGQSAGSLGAAAIAAVAAGLWENFDRIDQVHEVLQIKEPIIQNCEVYDKILPIFKQSSGYLSQLGDSLEEVEL